LAIAAGRIFGSIFSSFVIVINKPFQVGDKVRINNVFGTVEKIGLLYTDMIDLYGQRVHISNESVQTSTIENFGTRQFVRTDNTIYLDTTCTHNQITDAKKHISKILEKAEKK